MELPNSEIGISDILQWRDCPRRFVFGMQRHGELGESPESWSPANAYGSALHHAITLLDAGKDEHEAVTDAFAIWKQWLDPDDIDMMLGDLATYQERDPMGVRTIASEDDWRVPLFVHETAGQIYFRFKLDRLYQVIEQPHRFIGVDYKTSKWAKTEKEVNEDLQMWSYNWAIHEKLADLYPEHDEPELLQLYDQLKYGQVPTRKSAGQRESMKQWLIKAVTAMIADEELAPTFNEWCPWCAIKMDCPVVQLRLSDWARARIAVLMPREPKLKKDGTPSKVLEPVKLDPERFQEYAELLPDVKRARLTLESFEENVKNVIRELPVDKQGEIVNREAPNGYQLSHRPRREFTSEGLRLAHEQLGDEFYMVASLSAAALERYYGGEKEKIEEVTRLQVDGAGFDVVEPRR
ncbi:MAG: hypothetical protein NVS3B1_12650 [Marmoricola sp.]